MGPVRKNKTASLCRQMQFLNDLPVPLPLRLALQSQRPELPLQPRPLQPAPERRARHTQLRRYCCRTLPLFQAAPDPLFALKVGRHPS